MVLESIIAGVLAIVTPLFALGAEELGRTVGQAAIGQARRLWDTLKARLSNDVVATADLARFEQKPATFRAAVEETLKDRLAKDPNLLDELKRELEGMGPTLNIFMSIGKGTDVLGAQIDELSKGTANVHLTAQEGERVTGATIKKMG